MPKRVVYTCDCCGVEYEEPNLFDNEFISNFRFRMHRMAESGRCSETYSLKRESDDEIYLCPQCTKQFMKHLKDFGFKKVVSTGFLDENEIRL